MDNYVPLHVPNKGIPVIYAISNWVDGKVYIGGTTQYKIRMRNHWIRLRVGDHENRNLQSAYDRYGEESFTVSILETCTKVKLKEREQFWMDVAHNKYNIVHNAKGGRVPGVPLTEEWKRNIGKSALGNKGNVDAPRTEEWRRRLSESSKERWRKWREAR